LASWALSNPFQHDAAHVLVGEEIVAGELQVIQGALGVEEGDKTRVLSKVERGVLAVSGQTEQHSTFERCSPCYSTRAVFTLLGTPALRRPTGCGFATSRAEV
jgi:hypothetical protein